MNLSDVSVILDGVIVAAAIWMIFVVRGVGGVVGRTLSIITIGAIITGLAHLLATLTGSGKFSISRLGVSEAGVDFWKEIGITATGFGGFFHRIVVLIGFIVLVVGFQQLKAIKR